MQPLLISLCGTTTAVLVLTASLGAGSPAPLLVPAGREQSWQRCCSWPGVTWNCWEHLGLATLWLQARLGQCQRRALQRQPARAQPAMGLLLTHPLWSPSQSPGGCVSPLPCILATPHTPARAGGAATGRSAGTEQGRELPSAPQAAAAGGDGSGDPWAAALPSSPPKRGVTRAKELKPRGPVLNLAALAACCGRCQRRGHFCGCRNTASSRTRLPACEVWVLLGSSSRAAVAGTAGEPVSRRGIEVVWKVFCHPKKNSLIPFKAMLQHRDRKHWLCWQTGRLRPRKHQMWK